MSDMRDSIDAYVERWIKPSVRKQKAYSIEPSDGLIKLDTMENPFLWPEKLQEDWAARLKTASLNRYPDPDANELTEDFTNRYGLNDDTSVLFGNGSDEIIQLIATAVAQPGKKLMSPEPSFSMFRQVAQFQGLEFISVPLDENFELDLELTLNKIEREDPAVIFLAQPNNPTGNLWGREKLRRIIEAAQGLVVIDEAYTAFTDADFLSWVEELPNLLVMRTLSKIGLAGIRLGVLFGHKAWLEQINKVRLPYNINVLTQMTAKFALDNVGFLQDQTQELVRQRETLFQKLSEFSVLRLYPSQANFILVRCESGKGPALHSALKSRGILVKNLNDAHSSLQDCLRINVSSSSENAAMLTALNAVLTEDLSD